ncbi:MAG: M56 family metallopeptidase [Lachnospiraceae bacterium]|jgi:beta-lactamase regulating signal transducer with metallopeptidase domain
MLSFKMNMPFYLMVFYGSILIAAVLVLRGLLRDKLPKFVFPILWSAVLLRLLVPFSLSSPLSMKVPEFVMPLSYETTYADAVVEDLPIASYATEALAGTAEQTTEQTIAIAYAAADTSQSGILSLPLFVSFIYLYAAGFLITAGILLSQKYRYTKCLKDSLLIEHNETVNTLLREMGMGHILVFTNDQIASPLVCGLLSPKIYLPTRMDFGSTVLLRHILCHESMHIRRRDNILKAVMLLALCVHWFNPLVWLMSKMLCADLETACDEAVLRMFRDEDTRKDYACSLLAMAITGNRPTLLYSAFAKTEVERRIQSVLHYRKASALLLALSVCLVLSGSVVFATAGQAPFSPELTSFCSSDLCRWGVRVHLRRDVSLGKNAQARAEQILFEILRTDTTSDPDLLKMRITTALSDAFHVEKSAFSPELSLCLNREALFEEYTRWGLVRIGENNDTMLYHGETIRTYQDKTLGRYMSQPEGAVDLVVVRDRLGYITAVEAFREGDSAYDERTRKIEQDYHQYKYSDAPVTEEKEVSIN